MPEAAAIDLPALYDDYRALLDGKGFHTRYRLPALAAQALRQGHWPEGAEPAVIYYLPRRPSAGELELMQTLLARGKCRVIIGLSGDEGADRPALALHRRLTGAPPEPAGGDGTALQQKAGERLTITVAPDPVEEVRATVRRIAAMPSDAPLHRVAVLHRQEAPYASLLRQELAHAAIPYTGAPRRTLADTGAGRFLLGSLALAAAMGDDAAAPVIDRELLIDLLTSTSLRFGEYEDADGRRRGRAAPGVRWANLARAAHANGTVSQWTYRLNATVDGIEARIRERQKDEAPPDDSAASDSPEGNRAATPTERANAESLIEFLNRLAPRLQALRHPGNAPWAAAQEGLQSLLTDFLFRPFPTEADDRANVDRLLESLPGLSEWNADYSLSALQDGIANGLQSQVSQRGNPVGSGVYVGPPAGVAGGDYDTVFLVGLSEGEFPPPRRTTAFHQWLDQGSAPEDRDALERYEFLGAVAAAGDVILSYPAAGSDRRGAYPSRWLLEAAELIRHRVAPDGGAVTSENLATHPSLAPWRTVIPSREAGLRQLAVAAGDGTATALTPADAQDYNLMHLLPHAASALAGHPAWSDEPRLGRAVAAADARRGASLTRWDGLVVDALPQVEAIAELGSSDHPFSPSALETWATCPYRYFLSRVLRLNAPPSAEDDEEMSPLERGSLVHRILERFVTEGKATEDELLALADAEFAEAQRRGITGYPLLWELQQEKIREGLKAFFAGEADWLGQQPVESGAEQSFKDVVVEVPGLGPVHFGGKIDRIDVFDGEVRVRDFKTGKSANNYKAASAVPEPPAPPPPPPDLPAIAQDTLDKLRALAAERTDENDESDRWYREHFILGVGLAEQVLLVAHEPAQADQVLKENEAITNRGSVGSTQKWKRPLPDIRGDYASYFGALKAAVTAILNPPKQTNAVPSEYSVANGRALQLPVYLAAARELYPDRAVNASYCFPLADGGPAHDVGRYDGQNGQEGLFHQTLTHIIGSARQGIFPATPDRDAEYGNCRYCDFKQLCPVRRRQLWERKGGQDPTARAFNALGSAAAIETDTLGSENAD